MILVMLIAISGIILAASTIFLTNMARQTQLKIDQTKAAYLAQAGIMQAIYNWRIFNATDTSRRYTNLNVPVTGNNLFKTGGATNTTPIQANFAYYTFDLSGELTNWFQSGANWRLRRWRIRNINSTGSAGGGDITLAKVKVSWSPTNAALLNNIVFGGTSAWPGGLPAQASGATIDITDRTLTGNGGTVSGNTTYFQWNAQPPDPITVTCQWIFADEVANPTTVESRSHEIICWGSTTGVARGQVAGPPPKQHTFSITSTGQVAQNNFAVLKTVKAVVSGTPATPEIIDWEEGDKNIP